MEKNSSRVSPWITLFVFSFLVPSQFSIVFMGLRLSIYRIVLLLCIFPVAKIFFSRIKRLPVDYFVFVTAGLMFVSLLVNHGLDGLAFGGSLVLETIVPYLLGRVYIQNKEDLIAFADVHFKVILLLLIPVVYELFTGYNLFVHTFGGVITRNLQSIRFGLYRAEGSLDHPILLGVFAATGLALTSISIKNGIAKYLVVLVVSITSISSAVYLMLAMQIAMLKIEMLALARLSRYAFVLIGAYVFISIFSNRTPMEVLASYITMDPETAYYRILINRYAMDSVIQNPFFGIGLNDWHRPDWMPPSIDDFWLVIAVTHGMLTLTCLFIVMYFSLKSTYVNSSSRESVGIRVLLISIIVAAFTVHMWNSLYVFFWLLIGLSNNLGQFKPSNPINSKAL
jgi:hypothetical protein